MADFKTSTHRHKWIFTSQHLFEKREVANQRAMQMLEQYGLTRLEVDADGSLSYSEPLRDPKDKVEKQSLPKPLNCEEERPMQVFYEHKIQEMCGAFRFPHKIQATAIIFFKRFYLQWSMEHNPKNIIIRLSDGRYLAYREVGTPKEKASYKIILVHGLDGMKDLTLPVSQELMNELGVYILSFDRAGHAENDSNPEVNIQ